MYSPKSFNLNCEKCWPGLCSSANLLQTLKYIFLWFHFLFSYLFFFFLFSFYLFNSFSFFLWTLYTSFVVLENQLLYLSVSFFFSCFFRFYRWCLLSTLLLTYFDASLNREKTSKNKLTTYTYIQKKKGTHEKQCKFIFMSRILTYSYQFLTPPSKMQ